MENLPFLIARRRNLQRRGGPSWIAELEARTGLQSGIIRLVPAEESIPRERNRQNMVRQGLASGNFVRVSGCSLSDVASGWDSALSTCQMSVVVCDMLHHPDYVFTVPASCLVGKLASLLEFDGDTVGVTSSDLLNGFVVDMYAENGAVVFEKDMWGAWRQG